jgi:hypothetical protein
MMMMLTVSCALFIFHVLSFPRSSLFVFAELAENALAIDDSLSLIERIQRYMPSEHDLHRLFTTKLMPDAAEATCHLQTPQNI